MRRLLFIGGGLAAAVVLLLLLMSTAGEPTRPARPGESARADGPGEEIDAPAPDEEPGETVSGGGIAGVVLSPEGGPVPGAAVAALCMDVEFGEKLGSVEAVTDEAGRFRIDGLAEGDFAVRASAERIGAASLPLVRVPAQGLTEIEVRLSPPVAIAGRVVDPDGEPVPGARVSLDPDAPLRRLHHSVHRWWFGVRNDFSVVAGPDGRFRLTPLVGGLYDVWAEGPGFVRAEVKTVRAPASDLTIPLARGGSVRVVVNVRGEPRPERIDWALFPAGREEKLTPEGSRTEFVISGIPPGEQRLRVRAVGWTEETVEVAVRAGAEVGPVTVDLLPGTPVSGSVLERESGRPVSGARVELWFVERSALSHSRGLEETVTADAGGRYEARLRPGEWVAIPGLEGYGLPEELDPGLESQDKPFVVGSEPVERILHLSPFSAALTGAVRYADGSPVEGARVEVIAVENNEEYEDSGSVGMSADMEDEAGSDGAFRIEVGIVPWCMYTLLVTGPGGATAETEPIRFRKGEREASATLLLERPAALRGVVRGRIVDGRGTPVSAALVRAAGKSTTTGPDGRFFLEGLRGGAFVATYTAVGRPIAYSDRFTIPTDGTADLADLVLPDRGLQVVGRITGIADVPVPGAHVTVWFFLPGGGSWSVASSTETRPDGTYEIEGPVLQSARITVQASERSYQFQDREMTVGTGVTKVDMRLVAEVGITGTIRFPGETPREIKVQYRREDLGSWWNLEVDWDPDSGAFTATRLPAGRRRIRFRAEGYAPGNERTVDAPEDATVSIGTVVMAKGGTLTGKVVDASGRPVPEVQVSIKGAFLFTDTAEDGTFVIRNAPPGDQTLSVNGLEGREKSPTFPATIREGETTTVELDVGE